jgi:hypothetical protein
VIGPAPEGLDQAEALVVRPVGDVQPAAVQPQGAGRLGPQVQEVRLAQPGQRGRAEAGQPAGGAPGGRPLAGTCAGFGSQTPSRASAAASRMRIAGRVILPITGEIAAELTATAPNSVSRAPCS